MEKNFYKSTLIITGIAVGLIFLFWFVFFDPVLCKRVHAQTQTAYIPPAGRDIGQGSRETAWEFKQIGTGSTFRDYYGTQAVGVGTQGIIIGTSSALPYTEYNYNSGSPFFDFVNFSGGLRVAGSIVALQGSLTSYVLITNGTCTGLTGTNTTLQGTTTLTSILDLQATTTANGASISPTEVSYLDGLTGNINTFQTTHAHAGTDSVKISHDNVTGTGTNSHTTIDSHIADTSDPHGATLTQTNLVNTTGTITTAYINTLTVQGSVSGLEDADIPNTITLDNLTQVTTRNYNDISGTATIKPTQVAVGTDTLSGAVNVSGTITATGFAGSGAGLTDIDNLKDYGVVFTSPVNGHQIQFSGGNLVNATASASVGFGGITGTPTDNSFFSTTPAANKVPYSTDGTLANWGTNTFELIQMPGTTTTPSFNDNWQWFAKSVPGSTTGELLLHCNNLNTTFIDDSEVAAVITANGNVIGTSTNAKFDAGAAYYDGAGDYLSTPNNNNYQIAGDFIFDAWINTDLAGGDSMWPIISTKDTGTGFKGFRVYIDRPNKTILIQAGDTNDTSNNLINFTTSGTLTANTTQYLYVTAVGGTLSTFIDGVSAGVGTRGAGTIPNGSITIGYGHSSGSYFEGYMDEVRLVVGTPGYTTNFTSPTSPYDSVDNELQLYLLGPTGIGTATMKFVMPGTRTTKKSYCFINATTTVFGSSTVPTSTATAYLGIGVQNAGGLLFDSFNTYSTREIKTVSGEVVGTKSDFIDVIKALKIAEWSPKNGRLIEMSEAENQAKEGYISDNYKTWRETNEANYTSLVDTGTQTISVIDEKRMETDYKNAIELQWASEPKQAELIQSTKETLETNTSVKKITPIANDSTTPDIFKTKDGIGLNVENQIGVSMGAIKQLINLAERQQAEINDLKARLQRAGIQ